MPAHTDSGTGIRFGIGARPDDDGPVRNVPMTSSSRARTRSWVSGTATGAPVVPDVNERMATAGWRRPEPDTPGRVTTREPARETSVRSPKPASSEGGGETTTGAAAGR